MNILYTTSSSFLDSDLPLLKSYSEAGHSVFLIVTINPNGLKSTVVSIEKQHPVEGIFDYKDIYPKEFEMFAQYTCVKKLYILNLLTNSVKIRNIKIHFRINQLVVLHNIDIDHHIGIPCITSIPAKLFRRCKKIVTVHDPIPHENEELPKVRFLRIFVLKFINNVVLLNRVQKEGFFKHYYISRMNVYYSRLGNYDVLRLFGKRLQSDKRFILFYGRISQYKGVDILLKAFKNIENQFNDVKLIVAGKGTFHFDVTPYLNDSQIEFINSYISLDNLCSLIRSCEFAVCPYISATQSGVVASVLALGKPLIVTNVGGLPSMIENGKSGIVIEPNNVDELEESMKKLLSDKKTLVSMYKYIETSSKNGFYSWEEIAKNYISIYNQL